MTTNYPNMITNKENIKQNNLIEAYVLREKNTEDSKYLEQSQIKSLYFKVEKYAKTPDSKNEFNKEKIITSYLPLENQTIQNKENIYPLINNAIKNEINYDPNSLAKSQQQIGNISDFNEENNLANFSNFKTNKFHVVKEAEFSKENQPLNVVNSDKALKSKRESEKTLNPKSEALIEKDLFLYLKKFPEKKNEYLQNLIRTYNINFTNNIIDFSNKNLGTSEIELISSYLKKASEQFHCEEFKICGQHLSTRAVQDISGFLLQCRAIKYLDLSGCEIGDLGCRHLCEAFDKQKNLSEINLQKNSIGDTGAEFLSELLINNENISKLELEHNFIGNKGAAKLYDAIRKNLKIKWLNLFGNISISKNFIAKISTQLKNNRISCRGRKPQIKYPES